MNSLQGLHHVTAITTNAQRNLDFYTRVLGMRLVKATVNQDDTSAYHLFYADALGNPGTEMTFFEWRQVPPARPGAGTVAETVFRVAGGTAGLEAWHKHFVGHGLTVGEIEPLAGTNLPSLGFRDPEGQTLRLVAEEGTAPINSRYPWSGSPLAAEISVFGLSAVTLAIHDAAATARFLTEVLGFRSKQSDPSMFETGVGGPGTTLQLREETTPGGQGAGGVHHVAWLVEDSSELQDWVRRLTEHRTPNSGLVDRFYFRSLYFQIPGGILFELATRGPGFTADGEQVEALGQRLSLPPFLESRRAEIERGLRPLQR